LSEVLEARTGQQLSIGRRWRITTVLSGLLREHGINSLEDLIPRLVNPNEQTLVRKVVEAMLNNETYFFRDRAPFDLLAQQILPELAQRRASTRRLSIWSAGCSTGQEALSLAMIFAEQSSRWDGWSIDIYGTDVSEAVISTAKQGCYSQFEIQRGLGVAQMIKWFEESPQGWRASERLRRMTRFQVHNVLDPLPGGNTFDIVLCRNVLLYFDTATRERAFARLSDALSPDGWLMLGAGETVIGQTSLLEPDPKLVGLYRHIVPAASKPPTRRTTR
jgi:chemotaxis protein methyltransferase CheR